MSECMIGDGIACIACVVFNRLIPMRLCAFATDEPVNPQIAVQPTRMQVNVSTVLPK